jgi:hypothetical protein
MKEDKLDEEMTRLSRLAELKARATGPRSPMDSCHKFNIIPYYAKFHFADFLSSWFIILLLFFRQRFSNILRTIYLREK